MSAEAKNLEAIVKAGFKDAWTYIRRGTTGFTCCLKRETADDPPPFPGDHRIDHIFTQRGRTKIVGVKAVKVGVNPRNRTTGSPRLWPSDHGGWVGTFRLVAPQ